MRARLMIVFLFVAALGIAIDLLLDYLHVSRFSAALLENSLTGLGVTVAYYLRRRAMLRRLKGLADLNHHIRNALHVVTLASSIQDPENWHMVAEASERITNSLKSFTEDI
jgi:hypothetical protein